jgi:hypothetical protein
LASLSAAVGEGNVEGDLAERPGFLRLRMLQDL